MARSGPRGTASSARAPSDEPTNPAAKPSAARSRSSDSPCQYEATEVKAPKTACALLVPMASCGGSPAASSAGKVTRPPPPAIELTKPPKPAMAERRTMAAGDSTKTGGENTCPRSSAGRWSTSVQRPAVELTKKFLTAIRLPSGPKSSTV